MTGTYLVMALCVLLYILCALDAKKDPDRPLFYKLALIPMQVKRGQWYRLFTSAFLHGSISHLLMNMVALYNLGSVLEYRLGTIRFLICLFVSILGGSLFICRQEAPNSVTIGISGGLYGLMMIYFLLLYKYGLLGYSSVRRSVLYTILINLFISRMPGVSMSGHAGGSLAGILMGILFLYIL